MGKTRAVLPPLPTLIGHSENINSHLYFVTSHWFLYNLAFLTHKNNVEIEHECLSMLALVMPNDIGCANK